MARDVSDDERRAHHWLAVLRDGDEAEKIRARDILSGIFSRRGMWQEAIELCERNVREGVREPVLFDRLALAYTQLGDSERAATAALEARFLRTITAVRHGDGEADQGFPKEPEPDPIVPPVTGVPANRVGSQQTQHSWDHRRADRTKQNRPPDYEGSVPSGRRRRIAAWLVDSIVLGFIVSVLSALLILSGKQQPSITVSELQRQANGVQTIISPFIAFFYYFAFEASPWRSTLGKKLLGIQVSSVTSERASFLQILVRNMIRCAPFPIFVAAILITSIIMDDVGSMIPIFLITMVFMLIWVCGSCISAMVSRNRQSFHDFCARTIIVRS